MIYPKLSDGTIDWCVMCKHEGRDLYDGCCECEYPENSDDPPAKYKPKPMTNADRLRAMSDEELAKYFGEVKTWGGCPNHGARNCTENCADCWLDWLRQEATDA